ncbi:MAG: ABC transporter permease, partial [Gemella sp.]|nr:ABC transporter permease [Gemella sp.]
MKKTNVDLLREISRNKSKFISILIIMFLGVFVFAGLRETPPTMRNTANTYFKEVNIYDLHVTNERGISPELLKVVEDNKNVADYETYYQKEAKVDGYSNKIQLISLPNDIAKAKVVEGKLPETSDEMVLAESLRDKFSLGQTVKFTYKDKDNKEISKDYKVVGYVYGAHAPDATSSNKASLNFFAYVTEDNVKSDRFTG